MMPYFTKLHILLDAKKQLDAELREYIAKRLELPGRRRAIRLLTGSEEPATNSFSVRPWTIRTRAATSFGSRSDRAAYFPAEVIAPGRVVLPASPFLAFNLRDSLFHQFLDESERQWLVRGEVNGSL
jgi:hypothetical protein